MSCKFCDELIRGIAGGMIVWLDFWGAGFATAQDIANGMWSHEHFQHIQGLVSRQRGADTVPCRPCIRTPV